MQCAVDLWQSRLYEYNGVAAYHPPTLVGLPEPAQSLQIAEDGGTATSDLPHHLLLSLDRLLSELIQQMSI